MWSRKVFVALLRRYGLRPYRYRRQRYTTVMARVSRRFVDQTLWPEFQEIQASLQAYLTDVTDRVVHQVIHQDSSEAEVVETPGQLPPAQKETGATDAGHGPPAAAAGRTAEASAAPREASSTAAGHRPGGEYGRRAAARLQPTAAHNASTGRTDPERRGRVGAKRHDQQPGGSRKCATAGHLTGAQSLRARARSRSVPRRGRTRRNRRNKRKRR